MQDIIALDIGNSHCKLSLNTQTILVLANQNILANDFKLSLKQNYPRLLISISSVLNINHTKQLIEKLNIKLSWQQIKFIFWHSSDILKIALPTQYQQLSHLGSDRALRIYHLSQLEHDIPQIGVGCGTGFTIEIIQRGKLIESLILPGLKLQLNSLFQHTDKLPLIKPEAVEKILNSESGKLSTTYAICSGIIHSYIGLITQLSLQYQAKQIICSGAYAHLIQKFAHSNIQSKINVITHLELNVLQHLANYYE